MNKALVEPQPIVIDQHYSPQFYAELWGLSLSTVVRWFQDKNGVLKLNTKSARNGKRVRVELRSAARNCGSMCRTRVWASFCVTELSRILLGFFPYKALEGLSDLYNLPIVRVTEEERCRTR
jgi:hypothetical protein